MATTTPRYGFIGARPTAEHPAPTGDKAERLGLNTNFNPVLFMATLTNLVPETNYYFRFYATNASGGAWAPASAQFSTSRLAPSDYGAKMKLGFAGYTRPETLFNFPVLVRLDPTIPGFSYGQFASPVGGDLRFTDSSGVTLLPHEIDQWDTNGTSLVWVRLPQLSGPNDFIWAYWGNPGATSAPAWTTNGAVWSPENLLVWHLKESGFPYLDSTGQHPSLSGVTPSSTPGAIGRACSLNGALQYLDAGSLDVGPRIHALRVAQAGSVGQRYSNHLGQ